MGKIKKVLKSIHKIIDTFFSFFATNIITIALIWIFGAFLICILFRYFLHYSLASLEESYAIALLYMALIGGAYSFKVKSNTTFDFLYDAMGDTGKSVLNALSRIAIIIVFCILVPPVWNDILFYNMRKTSLLKISYTVLYMPFILILLSGIYYSAYYMITEDIPGIVKARLGKNADKKNREDGV